MKRNVMRASPRWVLPGAHTLDPRRSCGPHRELQPAPGCPAGRVRGCGRPRPTSRGRHPSRRRLLARCVFGRCAVPGPDEFGPDNPSGALSPRDRTADHLPDAGAGTLPNRTARRRHPARSAPLLTGPAEDGPSVLADMNSECGRKGKLLRWTQITFGVAVVASGLPLSDSPGLHRLVHLLGVTGSQTKPSQEILIHSPSRSTPQTRAATAKPPSTGRACRAVEACWSHPRRACLRAQNPLHTAGMGVQANPEIA